MTVNGDWNCKSLTRLCSTEVGKLRLEQYEDENDDMILLCGWTLSLST